MELTEETREWISKLLMGDAYASAGAAFLS